MTVTTNSVLNACIRVEEVRISRRVNIPQQIHFCLDSRLLEQIEQIPPNEHSLLSSANLANLRYYVLLNSLKQIGLSSPRRTLLSLGRSPLVFSTNYLFCDRSQPLTLFRSVIDLEGKISQQIQQQLWENPQLLKRVSRAHHWLILEVLAQLPLKSRNSSSWFIKSCFLAIAIATSMAIWYFFSGSIWFISAIGCAIFCLLSCCKQSIVKQMRTWIIYQLTTGFLATSVKKRQFGLNILSLLV